MYLLIKSFGVSTTLEPNCEFCKWLPEAAKLPWEEDPF